jgi:hypothetical protein
LTVGGTESARALAEADSNVFLAADTGNVVRETPAVRRSTDVRFGFGSLWSASSGGELTQIDPASGEIVATLSLEVEPTGLAVGEGSVWVSGTSRGSPTVYRIDPSINEIVDRFQLPMKGVVTDQTGEVAVGAGSIWIGHGAFKPGAWVERIDPATGRVQHRFPILGGDARHLAFGEGALWVASEASGELRKIDPRTNTVVFRREFRGQSACCVAVGGGFAWTAVNPAGHVWKTSSDGAVLESIELRGLIRNVTYAADALWVAAGEEGTVARTPSAIGWRTSTPDAASSPSACGKAWKT